ncbi:MAG: thrombospondin type 3 repeat-containing protein [Bacteroidales bacterium]|nr:thrombospondin type 3 repeat-containing protein [Bacteroidales bacterium]
MKKLWIIFLMTISLTGCLTQKKATVQQIGGFQYREVADYSPYDDSRYLTPYQDSIITFISWDDPQEIKIERIGGVDRCLIIKQEKRDSIEVIVYKDKRYNNIFNIGIFVAYSSNNGSTWDHYYTGLTQDAPLFVKWYSKYPLIDAEGNVQIEACLRSGKGNTHWPMSIPQVVKDGLLITFDLETLRKDSDGDGLTDIEEARLRTNPFNADTDNDGIPDNLDLNPRCNVPRTDKTIVYEVLLNEDIALPFYDEENPLVISEEFSETYYCTDTTKTVMIVTDDPNIRSIQPKTRRVIFLTAEEFGDPKSYNPGDLEKLRVSSFEKQEDGSYIVDIDHSSSGCTYRVKKTPKGWSIIVESVYIE